MQNNYMGFGGPYGGIVGNLNQPLNWNSPAGGPGGGGGSVAHISNSFRPQVVGGMNPQPLGGLKPQPFSGNPSSPVNPMDMEQYMRMLLLGGGGASPAMTGPGTFHPANTMGGGGGFQANPTMGYAMSGGGGLAPQNNNRQSYLMNGGGK